jgi:hypothetical protein
MIAFVNLDDGGNGSGAVTFLQNNYPDAKEFMRDW